MNGEIVVEAVTTDLSMSGQPKNGAWSKALRQVLPPPCKIQNGGDDWNAIFVISARDLVSHTLEFGLFSLSWDSHL